MHSEIFLRVLSPTANRPEEEGPSHMLYSLKHVV